MAVLPVGIGSAVGGYQIERSLRFNSADTAYLNRTPASAGNRKTWTWSGWVKKSKNSNFEAIFSAGTDPNGIYIDGGGVGGEFIGVDGHYNGTRVLRYTTAVFRDTSAWYHVVVALDTTQATDTNRLKLWVNGEQVSLTTATVGTWPALNSDGVINNNVAHSIGRRQSVPDGYFNGYLTEINFIDGQALTPSSFGEFNSDTGVWQPKKYTGTYGTNGFYLNFSDNSGTTSTTLGKDSSGNGNNWTPNNFSVTAGAGNDSLVDSPTRYGTDTGAGGEVRGNYATLNPLTASDAAVTYSEGNLRGTTASGNMQVVGTMPMNGKNYIEWTALSANGAITFSPDSNVGIAMFYNLTNRGVIYNDGTTAVAGSVSFTVNSGSIFSWTTNDIIGVAYDTSNGALTLTKNGGSTVSITVNGMSAAQLFPVYGNRTSGAATTVLLNAGQRPFAYTAPSGFKALVTTNLPAPTIADGGEYFNTVLYTGNGSTQSITGVGFQPDLVWIKSRSNAANHGLHDVLRVIGASEAILYSNLTDAESTGGAYLSSFNADGFTVNANTAGNGSGQTYVAWNWKANGAGVSNTAGTITSTVSVNTTSGFSIATYTGNGTGGATIGHGLGVSPGMIIIKSRSNATNWMVWHQSLAANFAFEGLNTTGAAVSGGSPSKYVRSVSSTLVTIGNDISVNQSASYTYVMYAFAPVAGYSAFGSYTGNGSADGPFVYTGFRPAFVMVKSSSASGNWLMQDSKRLGYNPSNSELYANLTNIESTADRADFLSNGFKPRINSLENNSSGVTYIYAAFAENPFSIALAR